MNFNDNFYQGKKVLITGHTGFKGSWLAQILLAEGAKVAGYALEPMTQPSLFALIGLDKEMESVIGDIREEEKLYRLFCEFQPEIVFHLAAQPLVLASYQQPKTTYETNVMGTVNVLECVRNSNTVRSFVNVTTDKVYENKEWVWGYRETDRLNGYDPYANSKSCAELVTDSYRKSFLAERQIAVSTVRAGNVIGGGDFTKGRIIPDCLYAALNHQTIKVKNPYSIRPYQHVLDALSAYLLVAEKQWNELSFADSYNIGPDVDECLKTESLVNLFCDFWGENLHWTTNSESSNGQNYESTVLKLDSSKIKEALGWNPKWPLIDSIKSVVEWGKAYRNAEDMGLITLEQIQKYLTS